MANARGSIPTGLDSLVRHIIEHPDFKQAVNAASSSSVAPSCSGVAASCSGVVASLSSGIASATAASRAGHNASVPVPRTPREELREIFHRRNASAPPQFQSRTNWQSAARGRGPQQSRSGWKRNQSAQGGKGKHPKPTTFLTAS